MKGYTVNGDPQKASEERLTPRDILTRAGFAPADSHRLAHGLERDWMPLDEPVPVQGQDFTAYYRGPAYQA